MKLLKIEYQNGMRSASRLSLLSFSTSVLASGPDADNKVEINTAESRRIGARIVAGRLCMEADAI